MQAQDIWYQRKLSERLPAEDYGEYCWAGALLFALTLVGLAIHTPWMGLVGDDWWIFSQLTKGDFLSAQLRAHPERPLGAYLWVGLFKLFGLRIWAYYALNLVLHWLTSLVIFTALRGTLGWDTERSFAVASILLLYPSDTAHLYLSALAARVSMLFAVISAALWMQGWQASPQLGVRKGLSVILMASSLLCYETTLLLFILLPLSHLGHKHRSWRWSTSICYAVVLAYFIFRLHAAQVLARRSNPYGSVNLTPDWLAAQLRALPGATTWLGWLCALQAFQGSGLIKSSVMLLVPAALLLFSMNALCTQGTEATDNWQRDAIFVVLGFLLSLVAVGPVMPSSFRIANAVGTLEGRLIHGAALGHGILVTHLCMLAGSALPLAQKWRRALPRILTATALSVAIIGNFQMQRDYVRSWHKQLGIAQELQNHAPAFRDDTAILLLEVPSGPLDARFYYPLTQLIRHFFSNQTLHVLPWQQGYAPDQQLLVFGCDHLLANVKIPQGKVRAFDYSSVVAFRVTAEGDLQSVRRINRRFLCGEECDNPSFPSSMDWKPTCEPVVLEDPDHRIMATSPADTPWRRLLLSQMQLMASSALP